MATISALCLAAIIDQYQAAQGALRRARDELEQRVRERTAALAKSEMQLREILDLDGFQQSEHMTANFRRCWSLEPESEIWCTGRPALGWFGPDDRPGFTAWSIDG